MEARRALGFRWITPLLNPIQLSSPFDFATMDFYPTTHRTHAVSQKYSEKNLLRQTKIHEPPIDF